MKTDVTQVMVDEHQLILRMVAVLEKNTDLVEKGHFRDWHFFLAAVDFIRHYADRFHHAKEEEVLFKALVTNGMPAENSPVAAMLMAHDQGREHVAAMEVAARKALEGETGQAAIITEHARGYIAMIRDHIDKEDTILYPLAERVLPQEMRPAMVAAYRQAEGAAPGLEERYRRLVEESERRAAS
jgi:hemerythrin-like domain-containing protein